MSSGMGRNRSVNCTRTTALYGSNCFVVNIQTEILFKFLFVGDVLKRRRQFLRILTITMLAGRL